MDNNKITYDAAPVSNEPEVNQNNGFICGLISLILSCCCGGGGIITIILAIISLVQGNAYKKAGGVLDGKYKAGKICSIVSLVIYVVAVIAGIIIGALYGAVIAAAMAENGYYGMY